MMAFCVKCGNVLKEGDNFCHKCGSRREDRYTAPDPGQQPTRTYEYDGQTSRSDASPAAGREGAADLGDVMPPDAAPAVDRKTRFLDGMLVLTHEDVVLYSGDEQLEMKRIPLASIESCSGGAISRMVMRAMDAGTGGRMSRSLIIKKRVNQEENFAEYLNEVEARMTRINSKLKGRRGRMRDFNSRQRGSRRQTRELYTELSKLEAEAERLRVDPDYIRLVKLEKADTKKESFKLPPEVGNLDEEYDIWIHAINRRLEGIKKIRVATVPPDAVVVVDGRVRDSTPCIIDKPLTDESAIRHKHRVEVFLEGYKRKKVMVDARPKSDSKNIDLKLSRLATPDAAADIRIRSMRQLLPDRAIDIGRYDVEYEAICDSYRVFLGSDVLLLVGADSKCLLEVPYGAISQVKPKKKFMKGIVGIDISYGKGDFSDLSLYIELDASAYDNAREISHRYEVLLERLNAKMEGSYVRVSGPLRRSDGYYSITEEDIADGFRRFDPYSFEKLVARLFNAMGYETEVTRGSNDMGVDVIARTSTEVIVIQVKKWNANVGGPDVHKTLGSMVSQKADRAIVVTTSDFTNQAYQIRRSGKHVELWNGKRLNAEMRKHLVAR